MELSRLTKSAIAKVVRGNIVARNLAHIGEIALFGSEFREGFLKRLLSLYYRSNFRRQWAWQVYGEPHFSIHSGALFSLLDGQMGRGIYTLTRAFLSAE